MPNDIETDAQAAFELFHSLDAIEGLQGPPTMAPQTGMVPGRPSGSPRRWAALGMKTSFKALIAVGWRPVAVMLIETIWIFALVITAVRLWG